MSTVYVPAPAITPLDANHRALVRELEDRYHAEIVHAQRLRDYEFNPYQALLSAYAYAKVIAELVPSEEHGVWGQREHDSRYEAGKLYDARDEWDGSYVDCGYDYIWGIYDPKRGGWGAAYLYSDEAYEARRQMIRQFGANQVPVPSPDDRLKAHRNAENLRDQEQAAGTYDRDRAHRKFLI